MKKWISILLFSVGSFFILKSLFKLDKKEQKVIITPIIKEEVIPVKENISKTPAPKLYNVPIGPYLESGKVRLNSKR